MTIEEARVRIADELITGYRTWLRDEAEMSDRDYAWKYGWGKGEVRHEDCLASFRTYNRYWGWGDYLPRLKNDGFDSSVLWDLRSSGWLSYKMYSNWRARAEHKTDLFFVPVRTAVEIYKAYKKEGTK